MANSFDEEKPEERESEEGGNSNGKIFLVLVAIPLFVFFMFYRIRGAEFGLTAALCTATILIAIGICWDLRERWWFWAVIAFVVAVHVPLVLFVRWPHQWIPGLALAPIGFVDCMIVVKFVRFVQMHIVKAPPPDEAE